MKKTIKIAVVALALICISLLAAYQYALKGGARNVATEEPAFVITGKKLKSEFESDGATATKKYLNQTILISGNITATQIGQLILEENIVCDFNSGTLSRTKGHAGVKGRFLGYDDLLGEIKLDQCSLIN